ncbi:hypothetical protein NG2371_06860 [Nocardia gamkensis]|nr:hypothetical protein [Nocardia gamkensis]
MAAKPTRVRTWTRPVVVVTLLMALLSGAGDDAA